MDDHAQRRTLDEIEQRIASQRFAYLHATWQADDERADDATRLLASSAAKQAEDEVDRLLEEWDRVRAGRKATTL